MTTLEEVDVSLKIQIKRHEVLKSIIKLIADLRRDDDEGAEWLLEKLAEG